MVKETFFIPKIPLTVSSIIFMLPRTSGVPSDSEGRVDIFEDIANVFEQPLCACPGWFLLPV